MLLSTFCNRAEADDKTCHFYESKKGCQAEYFSICHQIVMGTTNDAIREEAMIKDWKLIDLRAHSMKHESAAASKEEVSGVLIAN